MKIKTATITSVKIEETRNGDHCFALFIRSEQSPHFECGIGCFLLDYYDKEYDSVFICNKGLKAVKEICNLVGVKNYKKLKGRKIKFKDEGWGKEINEIGNIDDDRWFNFKEFFKDSED